MSNYSDYDNDIVKSPVEHYISEHADFAKVIANIERPSKKYSKVGRRFAIQLFKVIANGLNDELIKDDFNSSYENKLKISYIILNRHFDISEDDTKVILDFFNTFATGKNFSFQPLSELNKWRDQFCVCDLD